MPKQQQVPFINREDELAQIDQLIKEWDTRWVVCVHGQGGIGKTRLLQEVHNQYASADKTRLQVTDIMDFDDRTLHSPENVERRIAQIDEKAFESYLHRLLDWRKMEAAGVSQEELEKQGGRVRETLMDNFNQLSSERRVVLLWDTVERQERLETWGRLTDFILASKNALFVLAGRNARKLWKRLQPRLGENAKLIELQPFEMVSSLQYLEQKQRQLRITVGQDLKRKLSFLAQGRPILIDLAVEWLARDIPLDWLTGKNLEELESLPDADMAQLQVDFEIQLVRDIAQIRKPVHRLTLLMSRVYPLNAEMIVELLEISESEAEGLFEEAQTYVFVKLLADGRISLHDEMRRMVREYVWPKIDPEGDRRRRDSELAVKYFDHQIQALTERLQQLEAEQETARRSKDALAELNAFTAHHASERELWALREQLLFHTLFVDRGKGIRAFTEIFDEATRAYQFSFREVLLQQMQKYVVELSSEQRFEVDIRQAKYLLDSSQYSEARDLLATISSRTELQPEQQIDTLIQQANVEIRLGKFQDGTKSFAKAVQISKKYELKQWLAKAETGLGWAHRLTADLKKAREHYEIALDLAMEIDSKQQQALLYNNLGFVYAYIPEDRHKALPFCNASLSLWEELDNKRGIGRSYSTLGCVTFMAGQFNEALSHFQKALDIFEPAHDREWLSVVYSWRGALYMTVGEIDLAEEDMLQSLDMNIRKDRPIILSRLGQLYTHQGRLDKAQKAINECHKLALELPDVWYQLVSLRDMAGLAYRKGEYERLEDLEKLLDDYLDNWEAQDRRALGMLYLYLGYIALGKSDLDKAVNHFKLGLKPLAQLGRYGGDTPQIYVERLKTVMVKDLKLSTEQIRNVGTELLSFWQEERFSVTHPDVRVIFLKLANWQGA